VIPVRFRRLAHAGELPLPCRHSEQAAGLDLMAAAPEGEPVILRPGERALIPTGFAIELPPGFEGQVRPRSGLALKNGVTVLNAPGTIDSDYRGEMKVLLINLGDEPFEVTRGARIAQLVVTRYEAISPSETAELSGTSRGEKGFGSTGWTGR
jgi:dUTP pyrophosphatase